MNLSCNDNSKKHTTSKDSETKTEFKNTHVNEHCFLYAKNNDTIQLVLKEYKTTATGYLLFNFYQKDGSHGSFEGVMKGDTLFADYNFEAEGTKSKREIIFLKKGQTLLQGYGELEVDAHNRTVFKKDATITFDDKFPLTAVACDTLDL
ncbi:hypothetical protein [Gelidibacter sediminis]|nr:hypothetical protein [Gelidibacter sediminis]